MAGRPRKPTVLRLVTRGRTRPHHSENEPQPESCAPDPPPWLQGPALAAWNSVVDGLVTLGCVTRLDGQLLAAWASATGRAAEAEEQLNKLTGRARLLVESKHGFARANPLVAIISQSIKRSKRQRCNGHSATATRLKKPSKPA
jgi:phage terminase small subunit